MSNVLIAVATHKSYEFPKDPGYLPIHVGRALSAHSLGVTGDDTGENISNLNKKFCELTGLYWLWKNTDADVYGLAHYRRYFRPIKNKHSIWDCEVAATEDLVDLLKSYDVILSKPRNYWIETIETHYRNAHHESDLNQLKQIISEKYPDYLDSFSTIMRGRKISLYNMFVMKKELFQQYNDWLFSILFELEKRIDYKDYGPYQARVFGFLAERLLNIWVLKNIPKNKVKYLSVVNIEGENIFLKGVGLLERKFRGVKPN